MAEYKDMVRAMREIAVEMRLLTEVVAVQVSGLTHEDVKRELAERRREIQEGGLG